MRARARPRWTACMGSFGAETQARANSSSASRGRFCRSRTNPIAAKSCASALACSNGASRRSAPARSPVSSNRFASASACRPEGSRAIAPVLCPQYTDRARKYVRCWRMGAGLDSAKPNLRRHLISGRELFICDGFIDPSYVARIGAVVKTLHYQRKEKSRPDSPAAASSAEIAEAALKVDPFFLRLRQVAEQVFPGELLRDQRAYVNSS